MDESILESEYCGEVLVKKWMKIKTWFKVIFTESLKLSTDVQRYNTFVCIIEASGVVKLDWKQFWVVESI